MNSVTSVLAQPSGYLVQPATARPLNSRNLKVGGRHNLRIAPAAVSDLSVIYPEAVVASSRELGWQNLRALEIRYPTSEWTMPPLENHCIIIQLGPSVDATVEIGDQSFEQSLEPGAITIVPAGMSMDWRQE